MKYRIVSDGFAGYEVQVKHWYSPFWIQHGFTNTHSSLERAQAYVDKVINRTVYAEGKVPKGDSK